MSDEPVKEEKVSHFFSDRADQWGKHYRGGGFALRLFNSIFRRGLRRRWDSTMRSALPAVGKHFLDIGCGTGVYCHFLAEAGAAGVTGIDFAPNMLETARRAAVTLGVADRCEFILGDFMEIDLPRKFDLVFANGVFDYLEDYRPFWQKMVRVSKGIVKATFPGHTLLREPLRKFRYKRKGVEVYFYDRDAVESLGKTPGLKRYEIEQFRSGCILTGWVE